MVDTAQELTFHRLASVSDIPDGRAHLVEVAGLRLLICNVGGDFYTIDDMCTHDRGSLDQGELDGCQIECPRHGARFDVRTGAVKRMPAVRPVKTYATRVVDDGVEVQFAKPEADDDPFGF